MVVRHEGGRYWVGLGEDKATLSNPPLPALWWCKTHENQPNLPQQGNFKDTSQIFSYKYIHQWQELCSTFQTGSGSLTVQLTDTLKVWWKCIWKYNFLVAYCIIELQTSWTFGRGRRAMNAFSQITFKVPGPLICCIFKRVCSIFILKIIIPKFSWMADSNHKGDGLRIDLYHDCLSGISNTNN